MQLTFVPVSSNFNKLLISLYFVVLLGARELRVLILKTIAIFRVPPIWSFLSSVIGPQHMMYIQPRFDDHDGTRVLVGLTVSAGRCWST
jgi:hypothetical protein